MKEYIKLPEVKILSNSRSKLRELGDTDWKNHIFSHLLQFYKEIDNNEIVELICKEKQKKKADIEKVIKKRLIKWLKEDQRFGLNGFLVNREPSSDGAGEGFYDLKFEHSDWINKYFAFECKNLNLSSGSINEYVYNKAKQDGGVYRYMTNKYAMDLDFGGMLGFVIEGELNLIIRKIIAEIHKTFDINDIGQLTGRCIIEHAIENNSNTFNSIHLRPEENKIEKHIFTLHHIIMAFISQ